MKKYLSIGHWEDSKNITCVAWSCNTIRDFKNVLSGNGFVPYVIISEKKFEVLRNTDEFELFCEVKKMTSNYRKWNDICDYINQCFDIMEEKIENA